MSLSSIFSSEKLHTSGYRPWGAFIAVAILGLVELTVVRSGFVWSYVQKSPPGVVDAIESKVIKKLESPEIVVLGNSRIRDAVSPGELAAYFHLPEKSVVNAALTAGTPFDALTMYRRNRQVFSQAQVLVLGVDEFTLRHRTVPTERFRRFATLEERAKSFPEWETRFALTVGHFWRTYDASHSIGRTLKSILLRRNPPLEVAEDGRLIWRAKNLGPIDDAVKKAEVFYSHAADGATYEWWPFQQLLDLAQQDATSVVLYQPPLNPKYVAERDRLAPEAESRFQKIAQTMLEHPTVAMRVGLRPADAVALPEEAFWDYGHMRPAGSMMATRALAEQIAPLIQVPKD